MSEISFIIVALILFLTSLTIRAQHLGTLRLHEATFLTSHNAHANLAVAEGVIEPLGTNQEDTILEQLKIDGVRGLMLNITLNEEEAEPLRLVHGNSFIMLDYGDMKTSLEENLIPFLEENKDTIISIFLETVNDNDYITRDKILVQLKNIFTNLSVDGVPLKDLTFKYDDEKWTEYSDWPTINEMIQSNQRIMLFTDRTEHAESEYGFIFRENVLKENNWEGIEGCRERYKWGQDKVSLPGNDKWTRLFFMNHFSANSGLEGREETIGDNNLIGGGINGLGILYNRIKTCMANNNNHKPNFLSLDWVKGGDARAIRDYLNKCAEECPMVSADICLGCISEEYCSSVSEMELNTCQDKSLLEDETSIPSPIDEANTNTPSKRPVESSPIEANTNSPSKSSLESPPTLLPNSEPPSYSPSTTSPIRAEESDHPSSESVKTSTNPTRTPSLRPSPEEINSSNPTLPSTTSAPLDISQLQSQNKAINVRKTTLSAVAMGLLIMMIG